jgi:hypothetical protein
MGEHTVTHLLQPGDSLEGLAVQYGVSVADLKRANRIWSPQELFARRDVIVPLQAEAYFQHQQAQQQAKHVEKVRLAIDSFMSATGCLARAEAEAYLERANWSLQTALQEWHARGAAPEADEGQSRGPVRSLTPKTKRRLEQQEIYSDL